MPIALMRLSCFIFEQWAEAHEKMARVIRSHHPNQDIADKVLARLEPAYMASKAFVEELCLPR